MVLTAEDLSALLQDTRVKVYLIVLGLAIWRCTCIYHKTLVSSGKKSLDLAAHKAIPPLLSMTIIGITWFYIFRFIFEYQSTSESYFDDAYKDVLNRHYFTSTHLLTWAMVAVVWVSTDEIELHEGKGKGVTSFILYGFLGAMGASFVLLIPSRVLKKQQTEYVQHKRRFIPVIYAITSVMAFYCILMIRPCEATNNDRESDECLEDQGFGSFLKSFRLYLHGLHLVLVLPIGCTYFIPPTKQAQVDSAFFYGIMGTIISLWQLSQLFNGPQSSSLYQIPETDCQKSIHIDLLCCSILTLYAIYHDVDDCTSGSIGPFYKVFVSAFLMTILSPAAVLSFHLCLKNLPATHQDIVGKMQRRMAEHRQRGKEDVDNSDRCGWGWCNLGLWNNDSDEYGTACENLALALAEQAGLKSGDGVLSCGCGVAGKELALYYSRFDLGHITGIDPHVHIDCSVFDVQNVRKIRASVEDLIAGRIPVIRPHLFNKIVALDNIYHYSRKLDFFRYCHKNLPTGGKVAVTDIIWRNDPELHPAWVKFALLIMGVKSSCVWTETKYIRHLESLGFSNISIKRIGPHVFGGWKNILPASLVQHLEYGIIVANKLEDGSESRGTKNALRKKRVAVIGSGMAGLTAAHTIYSSAQSKDIEVIVYEAASQPGLAGNTIQIGGNLVDVPARMAAVGYYKEYMGLVKKLGISYQVVNTDCIFHGQDGMGNYVKHIYERSAWANFRHAVFTGGLGNLWKMAHAFSTIPSILANSSSKYQGLSFGDWLHSHLKLYASLPVQANDQSKHQGWQFSHFAQHENAFLYMAIGSFGWMLSCTYQQLIACPADILLPYIDGLGLTKFLGVFKKGDVVRIQPSIKALEHALLYGIHFEGNTKIKNLDEKKIINGIEYDAIICATDANAVPYVVRKCATVFGKFHYHPSTIYLHKDISLLPENRSNWRTWDVRMEPEQEEPQLTFWLNRYYGEIGFEGNVFQTWAPIKAPKNDCVIKKFEMSRVVHTSESKDMVKLVQDEQGKRGFYYAGSYAVYGMGLLEQAATSGRLAGEQVIQDLFRKSD